MRGLLRFHAGVHAGQIQQQEGVSQVLERRNVSFLERKSPNQEGFVHAGDFPLAAVARRSRSVERSRTLLAASGEVLDRQGRPQYRADQ